MTSSGISNLEQLERQVYESTWSDGLLDLCVGLALLVTGIFWVTGLSAYSTFAAPLMIPVWIVARRHITEPRMGVVKFGAERMSREKAYFLSLFIIGVLTFVGGLTWYFISTRDPSSGALQQLNIVAGLPAALLSVPAVIVALALGLPRFFTYAAALLVSAIPVIYLDTHPGWAFIPGGILCLCFGTALLVRFVNRTPKRA